MYEITHGKFQKLITDTMNQSQSQPKDPQKIDRLILMTGKIYYDVIKALQAKKSENIVIARLEQLYPFPDWKLKELFNSLPNLKECYWLQEEPQNMGAWLFIEDRLKNIASADIEIRCVSRTTSASPAAGLSKIHAKEQDGIIQQVI